MTLYVGTSGWSYPGGAGRWDGVFYPDKLQDQDKLAFYARYFQTVELNSSFYRPPSPSAARGWAAKTPADFRFTAKLWQKFTHPRMFEEATGRPAVLSDADFETFIEGLEPLVAAGKLGALLAQFPPSFKLDEGTLEYLGDLVHRFQAASYPLAVELRHHSWTDSELAAAAKRLMEDQHVAWVMIDEPKFRTSIRQVPLTTRLGYFRMHGRNYQQWWKHEAAEDRYNYRYSAAEQEQLAAEVWEVSRRTKDLYAFYNNHHSAQAVVNALEMQMALGEPWQAPLPEPLVQRYPELRGREDAYTALPREGDESRPV